MSSEMVASVLPLYLTLELQMSPAALGAIDGLHHGGASLLRIISGVVSDRSRRYQRIAAFGYGLSALSRLGLFIASTPLGMGVVTLIDRLGKGLRTSPRDSLISLSAAPNELGRAFGVHRTLDTAGALLGPLLAFGLLTLAPAAYDAVFVVSSVIAVLGVAVIVTFVRDTPPGARPAADHQRPARLVELAPRLLGQKRFRALAMGAMGLGLTTISDGFLYLLLQRRLELNPSHVPLLFVATPGVFMLLALPAGLLADRVGRVRVFLLGHVSLFACYAALLAPLPAAPALLIVVTLLGAFYAATDGVVVAMASALLPEDLRASGIGLLATGHQVGRMLAALGFGALWARFEVQTALLAFCMAGLLLLACVGAMLRNLEPRERV